MATGDKLAAALNKIGKGAARNPVLQVGFLENTAYPSGTEVALVAAVQNFGAPSRGIPPRPFFSKMIAEKSPEWPQTVKALLKENKYDAPAALSQMGAHIADQLQSAIRTFSGTPLKPATIARKGFEKQLIDTAFMLNNVNYRVKE